MSKVDWDAAGGNAMFIALDCLLRSHGKGDASPALLSTLASFVHRSVTLCEEAFGRVHEALIPVSGVLASWSCVV